MKQTSGTAGGATAGSARGRAARVTRTLSLLLAFTFVQASAASESLAFVPRPDRVADAVADANRVAGRHESLRLELTMAIGDRTDVGQGELVTHPSGLARLELRGAGGLVERHLLRGTERLASRNGERIGDARFFLPPIFLLQSQSGAALRAALESFGVMVDEIGLAPCGDDDCYLLGDPLRAVPRPTLPTVRGADGATPAATEPAAADDLAGRLVFSDGGTLADERADERADSALDELDEGGGADVAPARSLLWIEVETYAIRRLDSRGGVQVTFGPDALFDDLRVPAWIRIEESDKSPVRFNVLRATKVNAPASAFSEEWLDAPVIPDSAPGAAAP